MRTMFKVLAYAAVLACVSAIGSLQVNAADQALTRIADSGAPSMTDSADTAFRKLDRGAKGYVTYDDVAVLPDFAAAFGNADSTHLGRLNLTGFTQAWAAYTKKNN